MTENDDPSYRPASPTNREGPTVMFLPFPALSALPPDAWFEDEEGAEAEAEAERIRLANLRRRRAPGV